LASGIVPAKQIKPDVLPGFICKDWFGAVKQTLTVSKCHSPGLNKFNQIKQHLLWY
jgi:hypothetical protein